MCVCGGGLLERQRSRWAARGRGERAAAGACVCARRGAQPAAHQAPEGCSPARAQRKCLPARRQPPRGCPSALHRTLQTARWTAGSRRSGGWPAQRPAVRVRGRRGGRCARGVAGARGGGGKLAAQPRLARHDALAPGSARTSRGRGWMRRGKTKARAPSRRPPRPPAWWFMREGWGGGKGGGVEGWGGGGVVSGGAKAHPETAGAAVRASSHRGTPTHSPSRTHPHPVPRLPTPPTHPPTVSSSR